MTDMPPTGAQEPVSAPPSVNGNHPPGPGNTPAEIARDVQLTLRAVEDVDMRLQALQVGVMLVCGISLLTLALAFVELKRGQS